MTGASTYDPKVNILLDFIAIKESGGNYNAYIGHPDSTKDLSAMTIAEIYVFQRQLIEDGEPSTAMGRYQFLQRTLSGLVQQLKLSVMSLFTPELQDRLGSMLLDGRGYLHWANGSITDDAFAHNLSCEWASLPDPYNGGKSHYDGVGPNHAGQTLGAVAAALTHARAGEAPPVPIHDVPEPVAVTTETEPVPEPTQEQPTESVEAAQESTPEQPTE